MKNYIKYLLMPAVLAVFITLMIPPVRAEAAENSAWEDAGYIWVSSTEEGVSYIISACEAFQDEPLGLCYDPSQVDVSMLLYTLRLISSGNVSGINTYEQMIYNGYSCTYGYDHMLIDLDWKLTAAQEQLFDATVAMLAPYLVGPTQYDSIKNVHDWICMNTDYDDATVYGTADRHTGYNALFEHLAVCDGYATLFQKFMDKMGIPCYCVTGNSHAWNMVLCDGNWKFVDCTWDDQDYGIIYHFFMY